MITGPFDSVRNLFEGDDVRENTPAAGAVARRERTVHVSRLWESVKLALASIWCNKLRSLLTLLGNIVAVSSIIAVVALIQGVNGAVSDAIVSDLGADSFTIRRTGITRNQDEIDRQRNNPRITLDEARAIRALRHDDRRGDGAGAAELHASATAPRSCSRSPCRASPTTYLEFSTFDAERGRMMSPVEIAAQPAGGAGRLAGGRPAVRPGGSARQVHQGRRRAVPHRRRQRQEGRVLRQLAGRVRRDSARPVPEAVRLAPVARADGQAAQTAQVVALAKDEARIALRVARHLGPGEPDNFGIVASDSVLDIFQQATAGHRRGAGRRRGAVAARRRHRDHEHHADGRQRAHARDRPAQGARRQAAATSCRRC